MISVENQHDYTAVLAGATGLIGSALLDVLLADPNCQQVLVITRQALGRDDKRIIECLHPHLVFTHEDIDQLCLAPTSGFIALGTTLKQAGSKQCLANVDVHLVNSVADRMKQANIQRLSVVSSYGAARKSLSYYLQCKGLMEEYIQALEFDHTAIFRPGPLAGERQPPRTSEVITAAILNVINPVMIGQLRNLRLIDAHTVARAMWLANQSHLGLQILDNRAMEKLVAGADR